MDTWGYVKDSHDVCLVFLSLLACDAIDLGIYPEFEGRALGGPEFCQEFPVARVGLCRPSPCIVFVFKVRMMEENEREVDRCVEQTTGHVPSKEDEFCKMIVTRPSSADAFIVITCLDWQFASLRA